MAKDYAIAAKPTATVEQAIEWAKKKKASQLMIDLAPKYWEIATKVGINPVFSFCQTAYETAYMTFNGCLLNESFKNTAGIKRSDKEVQEIMKKHPGLDSSDNVAEAHMTFKSWEDSIKAQVDHSALYAGLKGYPKKYPSETTDPRHFDWCWGIGKTVLQWAPHYATNSYGERLVQMIEELNNTKAPVKVTEDKYYRIRKDWADKDSQLGAYLDLDLAIDNCPSGFNVYDPKGVQVYPKVVAKPTTPAATTPSNSKYVMTSTEFIKRLKEAADKYKTIYGLGMFGQPITKEIINQKAKQKGLEGWYAKNRAKLDAVVGKGYFGFDCVCLPKGILWGWNGNPNDERGGAVYCSNGVDDVSTDGILEVCSGISTDFSNIVAGEVVWMEGHVGIYVGDGKVVECTPKWTNDVQYSNLGNIAKYKTGNYRVWVKHGKLPWIEYIKEVKPAEPAKPQVTMITITLPELKKGMYQDSPYTEHVKVLQQLLIAKGYDLGASGADGSFGGATEAAVKKFQEKNGLGADGICGTKTWNKLLGN